MAPFLFDVAQLSMLNPTTLISFEDNLGSAEESLGYSLRILVLKQCHMKTPFNIERGSYFWGVCFKVVYPIAH